MRVNLTNESGAILSYQTSMSAGLDVVSTKDVILQPNKVEAVPTGLFIKDYDLEANMLGEIQVRARSSMAYKHNVILANGVGTIDLDYPKEIGVLLLNLGTEPYTVKAGDRIAQLVLAGVEYLSGDGIEIRGVDRIAGFGSTNING